MRYSIITAAAALLTVSACATEPANPLTTYNCGTQKVVVNSETNTATVNRLGKDITLTSVPVAAGAKYQSATAKTTFVVNGELGSLKVGKKKPVACEAPKA